MTAASDAVARGNLKVFEEIGLEFLHAPVVRRIGGRTTLLAHGDGYTFEVAGSEILCAHKRLQPTELVQESYLRLLDWRSVHWHNRAQFFATAARIWIIAPS